MINGSKGDIGGPPKTPDGLENLQLHQHAVGLLHQGFSGRPLHAWYMHIQLNFNAKAPRESYQYQRWHQ